MSLNKTVPNLNMALRGKFNRLIGGGVGEFEGVIHRIDKYLRENSFIHPDLYRIQIFTTHSWLEAGMGNLGIHFRFDQID